MTLPVDSVIGHYRVRSLLGHGGMGEVYAAEDLTLRRQVALKLVPPHLAANPDALERFRREARAAATISDPHVVTVHSIEEADGIHFLTMELVEGATLQTVVRPGGAPLSKVLDLMIGISDGVASAHDKGIVHRDLKPGNIMVTTGGRVKVLDFGLARLREAYEHQDAASQTGPGQSVTALTQAYQVLGTAAYMSPEQAAGAPTDHRSDIFALGTIMYELLSGERPFKGDTVLALLSSIVNDAPRPLIEVVPAVPREVWRVVRRALAKEPDNRYQNAKDLRNELRDLKQELDSGSAERVLPAPPLGRSGRPWMRLAAGAAAVVALAAVVLAPRGTAEDANRPAPAPQVVRFQITDPMPAMPRPEGVYHSVAISQDGSLIAYGTPTGGASGGRLYLRPLNGSPTPIAGEVPAFAPFFSPDGSRVGFRVGTDRYFVTSTRGGTPMAVTGPVLDAFTNAAWSGTDALIYESFGTIFRKSFSGDPEVVARPSESNRETWYYGVSPTLDGNAVLFSIVKDDMPSFDQALVAVRDLRTGHQKVLFQGGMSPSLTTTGHLLFARAGTLYAVEVDPATWEIKGSPVPVIDDVVTEPNDGVAPYAVSQNGTLAYLQGRSQPFTRRVMVFDRQGRALPFNIPPGPYINLRLSPDGQRLALSSYGANVHTWLYDLQRETLERLTETWSNEGLEWSRDGKHIAQISNRGGEQHLVLTSVAEPSNGLRLLTSPQLRPGTAFSADGRHVIFSDGADLFRLTTDGRGSQGSLVATRAVEVGPAASPDGRWLAFAGSDTGTPEIYVVAADGQGRRQQISRSGGINPRWTKGGKELCFRAGLSISCVAIGPDGAAAGGLQASITSKEPFGAWDVSPDGERFCLLRADVEGRQMTAPIQVVVNWFEELRTKMAR